MSNLFELDGVVYLVTDQSDTSVCGEVVTRDSLQADVDDATGLLAQFDALQAPAAPAQDQTTAPATPAPVETPAPAETPAAPAAPAETPAAPATDTPSPDSPAPATEAQAVATAPAETPAPATDAQPTAASDEFQEATPVKVFPM